jgi:hypothetical protein
LTLLASPASALSASSGLLATSASLASLATSVLLSALPAYQLFGFVCFPIGQKQDHTATSSSMHTELARCDQGQPKLPMQQFGKIALLLCFKLICL